MATPRGRRGAGVSRARRPGHDGAAKQRPLRESPREQVIEIQRARMLTAMVEACGERGVGNVAVAHVVARAGISRRTFYELFEDREDCFLAAFDHALEHAASIVIPAYESESAWREQVRAGLTALLGFLEDEPELGKLLVVDTLGAGPRALAYRTNVFGVLIGAIDRGRGQSKSGKGPPPLTAEGIVGAVFSVVHARLLEQQATTTGHNTNGRSAPNRQPPPGPAEALSGLLNPLMSMIVLPYLGQSAARRELERPTPTIRKPRPSRTNPLKDLDMRLTYRTVRVLLAIAEHPGASNRQIGEQAGIHDQGQISKLLGRLHKLGLIQNTGEGHAKGAPNEWTLTTKGHDVQHAIGAQTRR